MNPFVFAECEEGQQRLITALEADGDHYWAARFRALPKVVDAHTAAFVQGTIAEMEGRVIEEPKKKGGLGMTLLTIVVFVFLISNPGGWAILLIMWLVRRSQPQQAPPPGTPHNSNPLTNGLQI